MLFACSVLGRPGSDLLSQVLRHSTIGADVFDGRVRDGIGSDHDAKATRPAKNSRSKRGRVSPARIEALWAVDPEAWSFAMRLVCLGRASINESDQADRAISTGQLHRLPCFHIRPINVVVFHGSRGRTRFEVGFPLRCIQRLSRPYIATLHCDWRHNRSTRGTFIPVLSY